jgi:mRNA interferase HigB
MHLISLRKLREFWSQAGRSDAKDALGKWFRTAKSATWNSVTAIRRTYAVADPVGGFIVFNICGNKHRLVVLIDFEKQKLFIRHVLRHDEYDRGAWKSDPWFKARKRKK